MSIEETPANVLTYKSFVDSEDSQFILQNLIYIHNASLYFAAFLNNCYIHVHPNAISSSKF